MSPKKIIGKIQNGRREVPLFSVEIINDSALPWVLLSAGIHGDEPSGVTALEEFVNEQMSAYAEKFNFIVLPCMNPVGCARGTRENGNGIDLNRNFSSKKPEKEVRAIQKYITSLHKKFLVAVDMHEDPTDSVEPGFALKDNPRAVYLYEVSDKKKRLGKKITSQLRVGGFQVTGKKTIYGEAVENGVVWTPPSRESVWPGSFTDEFLPAFTSHIFVIETPTCWPRKKRVRAHTQALSLILQAFSSGS